MPQYADLKTCVILYDMFFSDNDPWNSAGAAAAGQPLPTKPDSFSPALRSSHSPAAPANNDPWMPTAGAAAEPPSDPFSPVAQTQLAEFDLLRDQMEKGPETHTNNGGELHSLFYL